jgi:16S rRNA processing protein RimM
LNRSSEENSQWVQVARILRPRGNKGEVLAELLTDFPARLSTLKQVFVRKDDGKVRPVALQNFWIDRNHPSTGVFHLADCSTISDAEALRGYDLLLPFAERVTLPAGQYFVTDLIGCTVFELPLAEANLASPPCAMEEAPRVIGTVRDVFFPGEGVAGTPLLQVDTTRGELLLPLAEDICTRIDVAARRIEVRLPAGLSELNTSAS